MLISMFKDYLDEDGTMSEERLKGIFQKLDIDLPPVIEAAGPDIWGERIKIENLFCWLFTIGKQVAVLPSLPDDLVLKFHSAVRWGKPWSDIEAVLGGESLAAACAAKDPKNGNFALHIASQNGHLALVTQLIASGAGVNDQNGKGQTPLHMSVEYDFYFVSKALLAAGADRELPNNDGHKAITGIDGGKINKDSWDNAVTILKASTTPDQLGEALGFLEMAPPESVDKAELIQAGMVKKKNPMTKAHWDHKRFMALAAKF